MSSFSTFSLLYVTTLLTQTSTGFHIMAKVLAWTLYCFIDQLMLGFSFSGPYLLLLNLKILAKRYPSSDLNHRHRVGETPLSAETSPIRRCKRFGGRCLTKRSVKRVKGLLNRRPRKRLGVATPAEVFFGKSLGENFAFQSWIRHHFIAIVYLFAVLISGFDWLFKKAKLLSAIRVQKTIFINCFDKKHWLLKLFFLNLLQWETDGSAE